MARKNKRVGNHAFWGRENEIGRLEHLLDEKNEDVENTPEKVEESSKEVFIKSLEVEETPIAKKKIQSAKDYPENAIIMSMGPSSTGKTEFLGQIFDKEEIFSYWDIHQEIVSKQMEETPNEAIQQRTFKNLNREYFSIISKALFNNPNGKAVIDADCLALEFRNAVYELAKRTKRPVFIMTQSTTYEESLKNIRRRYKGVPFAFAKKERSREALETTTEIFKRVHSKLEDELRKKGLLLDDYEGQVIDIMHGPKTKKERSRD